MIKKFLIYGLIVMLLIVSLFVFTGCSSKETEEKNEEIVISNDDSKNQEDKNEKKHLLELYGLKKEDCLPKFDYTEVIEGKDGATVVIKLPEDKVLSENEISQYRLQIANAIVEASDDKKVYDMNGTKELVSDAERSCGTYVYTTNGNKYTVIVVMYSKAGNPIQIVFEKM